MKQEFEMRQEQMDAIIAINKDRMPVIKIGSVNVGMDLQDQINEFWRVLGLEYGFNSKTVEASSKGKLFFLAEATESLMDKLQRIKEEGWNKIRRLSAELEDSKQELERDLDSIRKEIADQPEGVEHTEATQ